MILSFQLPSVVTTTPRRRAARENHASGFLSIFFLERLLLSVCEIDIIIIITELPCLDEVLQLVVWFSGGPKNFVQKNLVTDVTEYRSFVVLLTARSC